jgi:hypothetical protein
MAGESRKGKAAELLVAATCIIESEGKLNAWVSYVDDEGVDLIVQRKDSPRFVALQVKSRFATAATITRGQFITDLRQLTFAPRHDFYVLFVVVNHPPARIELCWLVPSMDLAARVQPNRRGLYRFAASTGPQATGHWSHYRLAGGDLAAELVRVLEMP